jgi:isopenicillin N synthase-like dioxygenase
MTFLPTIDLQRLARGADGRATTLDDLRLTVGTTGAFYLVGHGIEPEAADRLFALTRRFFALSES